MRRASIIRHLEFNIILISQIITMAKKLCLASVLICLLVFILFVVDISVGIPFSRASIVMDIVMMVSSLTILVLSWLTFREQDK